MFSLTGEFLTGLRADIIEKTEMAGGNYTKNVVLKTNYLIVGYLGSESWCHGSFGSKIERAIELKSETDIKIIDVESWLVALDN